MKILYVNAVVAPPAGEILCQGVSQGLAKSPFARRGEKIELLSYDIFYGRQASPCLMGAFARYHDVDGVILSGSEKNTTDRNDPWVVDYLRGLKDLLEVTPDMSDWSGPAIPILGICFGHQAIACALGGETSRFNRYVNKVPVKALPRAYTHPLFKNIFEREPESTNLNVLVTHADQVVRTPQGFHSLLTSDYCPVQAMAHDQWPVVSLQSHPEITRALKAHPDDEMDWRHLSLDDMDTHHGPKILAEFVEWISRS